MTSIRCSPVPRALLAGFALAICVCDAAWAQQEFEQPTVRASDLAPAVLLKGPAHTVDENVTFENFLPRFTIRSVYGTWEARGREMLDIRVAELSAFGQLDSISKSDEFVSALGRAVA